ncbi:MAG TPA: ferrochelatase [Acidimicrobiales bacterium]|nr:ferrochelatase [Acidimicrobiales bacterium]
MSATTGRPIGVLVMAHGTPDDPGEIEAFYTRIRRGRPPTPELLAELMGRYRAIGGTSPLTAVTRDQVDGLSHALEALEPGRFTVRLGTKYTRPSIEDAVAELVGTGIEQLVGLVLTPHESIAGSGGYLTRAEAAAQHEGGPGLIAVRSWHRAPGLAALLAGRTRDALDKLDPSARRQVSLFFTAHSVPARAIEEDDPYPLQVAESGSDVAAILGLDADPTITWEVAWQSAGRTDDAWLGPDLLTEIDRAASEGASAAAVCPVGFVSDHLEILYDLDLEARARAGARGISFARTESLNSDPAFLDLLARVVLDAVGMGR